MFPLKYLGINRLNQVERMHQSQKLQTYGMQVVNVTYKYINIIIVNPL